MFILHLKWTGQWEEGQLSTRILLARNGCVAYVAAFTGKICPQDYLNQATVKEGGVTFLGVTGKYTVTYQRTEGEDVPVSSLRLSGNRRDCETTQGFVRVVKDPRVRCGRYLQGHLLRVPVRPQVLQESQGPLPAALLLLILNRDVQLGDLRGAGRDVYVIGHGPGDGRDYHDDDRDGDHESGGRRQAGGSFRPGAPSREGWGRSD